MNYASDCSRCEGVRVSMVIQVRVKNVYGNETIYPVCDKAKTFAAMVKQSTLTRTDIKHIKALGFAVEVVTDKVSL